MHDVPYTTPEEDPFNVHPRRHSSLLNKWLQEQHSQNIHLTAGYDLVDDNDIPQNISCEREVPSTPRSSRRTSKLLHTPSSFRHFNLTFRSASPATTPPSDGGSPRLSRFSFLPRSQRNSTDPVPSTNNRHNRSSSLSTLNLNHPSSSETTSVAPSSRWRPSILDHFSPSQTPVVPCDAQCRPSMSSADTYTSASPTTVETDSLQTPSNLTLMDPIRCPSSVFKSKSGFASSSSVWSQKNVTVPSHSSPALLRAGPLLPSASGLSQKSLGSRLPLAMKSTTQLPNAQATNGDEDDLDEDDGGSTNVDVQALKQRRPSRPQIAYSASGTLPRVKFASLSSRQRKKKKLVVSGIGINESRRFEGVKRWCESFGEVSQIVRMPNGDLHVHFRLAEVADTVCRLRAKVYIAGVGSVQLSWFIGDKR